MFNDVAMERIGDGLSTVEGKVCEVDEDGDLILPRRTQHTGNCSSTIRIIGFSSHLCLLIVFSSFSNLVLLIF